MEDPAKFTDDDARALLALTDGDLGACLDFVKQQYPVDAEPDYKITEQYWNGPWERTWNYEYEHSRARAAADARERLK